MNKAIQDIKNSVNSINLGLIFIDNSSEGPIHPTINLLDKYDNCFFNINLIAIRGGNKMKI